MMYESENAIKIAVLQEQLLGLRAQQEHNNHGMQCRLSALEGKIDELTAILNRGRGAYAASMALSAAIGGVLLAGIRIAASYMHR